MMESNADIEAICDRYKIVPSIIGNGVTIGNFTDTTMDVFVDIKKVESIRITKEMHDLGILPEKLSIEII